MEETPPIWRTFMIQLKDNMALLAMVVLILAAVVLTDVDPMIATLLWALALGAALFRVARGVPQAAQAKADAQAVPATRSTDAINEIIDALDMPIVVLADDSSIVSQNRAAERSFGPLTTGLHVSARWRSPGILDMIRETIATGEPNQIEHSERLPSERVYIVRIGPIVRQGAEDDPRLFLLSFRDISDLRRLDRMRSDFVANASHELRTPLASLRGFLETLQGPAKNDPKAQERFIGIMLEQANRMSRLVDDLLSLSRLELKAHIAPDERVDLVPLLGHVRDSLMPLAGDLDIDIRLHLPAGKVEVTGDRDELVQVFENLIENACKYGQEGKTVDVYLKNEPDSAVEVSVVDHGPGIPAEHVPRLTERFYRVSATDSRSKKGTGLGLAIVKHILTRHRARLIIRSEIDRGAEFTVRF